jgi:predicted dehydrogenase
MARNLRVGIIGANARGGWAGEAHVPAVQGLPGLELVAVATNSRETADEAAHVFGVSKAYADGAALVADPDVDIVTVATRVPDHRALVLAAATAGKHIYSEWPLGRGFDESAAMARAVKSAGVHGVIGLQLRGSPTVEAARRRLVGGTIGRVLSVRAYSSTAGFGPDVAAPFAYLEDPASFANLVTIQGAHTLDLLLALVGPAKMISALLSRQYPDVRIGNDVTPRRRETFDHMLVQGSLQGGASFAMEVAGGRTGETPFRLDIVGEHATLRLDGGAPRGLQSSRIGLLLDGKRVSEDEGEVAGFADPAANVGGLYERLRDDIHAGTRTAPDFDQAARLTWLAEALFVASSEGSRISIASAKR